MSINIAGEPLEWLFKARLKATAAFVSMPRPQEELLLGPLLARDALAPEVDLGRLVHRLSVIDLVSL